MEHLLEVRKQLRERISRAPGVARVLAGEASGEAARDFYRRYLVNVWHYACHSAIVIGTAGARAVPKNPRLADYLLHHAREELGHEEWALEDLTTLGMTPEQLRATRPLPSCAAMIGYEYYVAGHANPIGLFGWLYVLESMGDDLGSLVSEKLLAGLGSGAGVRFLAGHGEADEAHTADLTVQIRDNVEAADRPDVHHVADVVAELYGRIFEELGDGR